MKIEIKKRKMKSNKLVAEAANMRHCMLLVQLMLML